MWTDVEEMERNARRVCGIAIVVRTMVTDEASAGTIVQQVFFGCPDLYGKRL